MKSFSFRQKFQNSIAENVTCEPLPGLGRSLWIVGRSLCLFKTFFIPEDVKDKSSALSLHLQQWSPFPDTGQYVVWQGGSALVWIWDETLRLKLVADHNGGNAVPVPEDLFFGRADQNGVRLVPCLSGVVAEYWQDLVLCDSRWWAESPNLNDVQQFYRANDLPLPVECPEYSSLTQSLKPWGTSTHQQGSTMSRYERFVLPFFSLLLMLLAFQAVSLIKWNDFEQQLMARSEVLKIQVEPILNARQQAYEQKTAITELTQLAPYPAQLHMWATIVRTLRDKEATIRTWKYYNGKLELTVMGPALNGGDLIRIFAKEPMFTEISSPSSRKPAEIRLKMNVVEHRLHQAEVVK